MILPPKRQVAIFLFVLVIFSLFGYVLILANSKSEILKHDRAYVTLATNDEGVIGVLTLAYSLREVNSKYPLVILVSHQVSEQNLKVIRTQLF